MIAIENLESEWESDCTRISSESELDALRAKWLGSKGIFKTLFRELASCSPETRSALAKGINALKSTVERWLADKSGQLSRDTFEQRCTSQYLDCSLPSRGCGVGAVHPIRQIERRITALLQPFGFRIAEGPEIESEYYCFDALNIPKHHPARDMQDTFYVDPEGVLRTHTTSVQARELKRSVVPVKSISCGRVYRNEAEDSSHQSMFHQYEMVWVEPGLTLAHLMGLIVHVLHGLYGKERGVRFVPKYYPYTSPSIGAQISCSACCGVGCSFCKGSGWVTIVGAGMIHENVLKEFRHDPKVVSGLAFGFGTSRLVAQFYPGSTMKSLYTGWRLS